MDHAKGFGVGSAGLRRWVPPAAVWGFLLLVLCVVGL